MSFNVWLLYCTTIFLMSATPGPNMLLAMTHGMRYGNRRALITCAGLMIGLLVIMCASMLGLGAILAASERLFSLLKYAGAAYLVYLGVKLWRDPAIASGLAVDVTRAVATEGAPVALFRTGMLVALSNPKAFLFFTAFFPQFFNKAEPQGLQFAILAATFVAVEGVWQIIYMTGGTRASRVLGAPGRLRLVNRISGSLFIGLAFLLATARRA